MGYLNNSIVTVDAILTRKGRELLARNDGSFRITQFALSDDEVDYTMYNPNNPLGSAYYGQAIDNMPLLEAFPQSTQVMKYKLTTLPRGTAKMPILDLGYSAIVIKQGASLAITPQTLNYFGGNTFETAGYTATISDVRLMSTFEGVGINTPAVEALNLANQTTTTGTSVSRTVVGSTIDTLKSCYKHISNDELTKRLESGVKFTINDKTDRPPEYNAENVDFCNWLDKNIRERHNSLLNLKDVCESYLDKKNIHSSVANRIRIDLESWIRRRFDNIRYIYTDSSLNGIRYKGWIGLELAV